MGLNVKDALSRIGETEMKAKQFLRAVGAAAVAAALALSVSAAPAHAAGGKIEVIDYDWSFEGPFGTFDEAQLQRGWQVYSEVCASCHSMDYLHYRDLGREGGPHFPPEQVEAMAAMFMIPDIDDEGTAIERPALPTDLLRSPHENRAAAVAIHGAYPPELSLIVRARKGYSGIITQIMEGGGGAEYVYSVLMGYVDAPNNFDVPPGTHFNAYYPGHAIKMASPLVDGAVTYQDGSPETLQQYAADVTAFMAWASDPDMEARKRAGLANLIFLSIFAVLLWFSTKKLWKRIKNGEDV